MYNSAASAFNHTMMLFVDSILQNLAILLFARDVETCSFSKGPCASYWDVQSIHPYTAERRDVLYCTSPLVILDVMAFRCCAMLWSGKYLHWTNTKLDTAQGADAEIKYKVFKRTRVFIGPRCPWGPIYGSGSLSLTEWDTLLQT